MEEVVALLNKLASASFGVLVALILYGSWKGIWVWGRHLAEADARYKADLRRVQEEVDWWRSLAVKATGIAEVQGHVLRVKENKELAKVDDANKRFLDGG